MAKKALIGVLAVSLTFLAAAIIPGAEARTQPVAQVGPKTAPSGLASRQTAFGGQDWFIKIGEWGSSGSNPGQFNSPEGIAVDPSGNVYVADQGNKRVQKFSPQGEFLIQWGQPGSGTVEFNSPWGVAVDPEGFVYVTDNDAKHQGIVYKFTSDGELVQSWGVSAFLPDEEPNPFTGIAADSAGFIYVVQNYPAGVWKFTSDGQYIWRSGSRYLYRPGPVAVDGAGNAYVSDGANGVVVKLSPGGDVIANWLQDENGEDLFHAPSGLAVNPMGGSLIGTPQFLYVLDSTDISDSQQRISRFDLDGHRITELQNGNFGTGRLAATPDCLIYVTNPLLNKVSLFFDIGGYLSRLLHQ